MDLKKQCDQLDIKVTDKLEEDLDSTYDLIVDSIFGYSFKGTSLRAPFDSIIETVNKSKVPVAAVDVPSGWDIDSEGDVHPIGIKDPALLISLTAPKLCAKNYKGIHYLGGRFVPPKLAQKHNLNLPVYPGSEQIICLSKESKL
eukprot:TRINITY_DN16408_c0_g1_i1.p1 TRINITY_DN16408_c0_g1~~TRINITY_DN16408_c0_g1_i1.p1  ORF type:complete len:144 (+),score=28.87 TRINITY_DN16408_c0_g1_i1:344-775(+)